MASDKEAIIIFWIKSGSGCKNADFGAFLKNMIRKLMEKDIQAVVEMMDRVFMDKIVSPKELREEIRAVYMSEKFWKRKFSECEIFADEEGGKFSAVGAYKGNEIDKLYVAADSKGKGKGSLMLKFLEDTIRSNGHDNVFLYALLTAVGFYENRGYHSEGDGEIELASGSIPTKLMRKNLE